MSDRPLLELRGVQERYAPFKTSLYESFDGMVDALNASRYDGVTSLREHGRMLARELKGLEADHGGAPWHKACKAIFTKRWSLAV